MLKLALLATNILFKMVFDDRAFFESLGSGSAEPDPYLHNWALAHSTAERDTAEENLVFLHCCEVMFLSLELSSPEPVDAAIQNSINFSDKEQRRPIILNSLQPT